MSEFSSILTGTGYPGAESSKARNDFFSFPTNSRKELSAFTRKEIQRKFRALDAALGIYSRIKTKIGQHAVGKGVFPDPVTTDSDWNESNKARFENWASNPFTYSIDGSRDFWEDQRIAAETVGGGDGEFFEALIRTPNGAGMVQPLDCFEIETPGGGAGLVPSQYEDGVRTNSYLRPLGYAVRELSAPNQPFQAKWRDIPADSMIHLFKRRRAKQMRGLPFGYSGVNRGIDALEMISLESGSAKLHSGLGLTVNKKKGEAGHGGITDKLTKVLGPDGKPAEVSEEFWKGAGIHYLNIDEEMKLLMSGRPSPNLLAFIEFLYRDLCMATGLPYEVIVNLASLGGATARAVLEDAQWFFEMIQDMIIMRHSQRIYVWNTALAMRDGTQPRCKDPYWWAVEWHGPAKLTVDLGKTADANIKLLKNGGLSFGRYYEERGQNAKTELTRQMDFLEWLDKECKERGIDVSRLIEPTPGSVTNVNMPEKSDS